MTPDVEHDSPLGPDELIAYLDGEVDSETRQQIEQRLARDPQLVQRMREHQQAWDFLDELPQEDVGEQFTNTTLNMVAIAAADEGEARTRNAAQRRTWLAGITTTCLIGVLLLGYWVTATTLDRSNRELLQNLPVIENLEALEQAESVEFLIALENEGLFVAEESDAP